MPDYGGRVRRLGERAFQSGRRSTWLRQLRSAVLLDQIRHPDTSTPSFTFDTLEVARVNDLVRLGELTRSPRERRADPGQLPTVAQTYADLAQRLPRGSPRRAELLALAASTWSLAGYQANAAALADDYLAEIDTAAGREPLGVDPTPAAAPAAIAVVVGAVLRRDVYEVGRLGEMADFAVRQLGRRFLDETGERPLDRADAAVLAVYGLVGRSARALTRFWRRGDHDGGQQAVDDLRRAARLLLDAAVVDTWVLVDNLAYVVEDAVAVSPWRLLRRAPNWNRLWVRYLRRLAVAEPPAVQVWPSQRQVLEAGLLDRDHANLTVTMPTSAGKTHIAEWAILRALAEANPAGAPSKLAVYVVPSRALAREVERHLTSSLGAVGFRVSGLFGGFEHVDYELGLIAATDVLVVTSEKFDLLLRNDDKLAERLSLVVADEGHLLGEKDRGLRLEMTLTRVRRVTLSARVLVLSAVLPNSEDIARWLTSGNTEPRLAEVEWSPSQLHIGVFSWEGEAVDGQQGFVRYHSDEATPGFFLPHVLTRHIRRTKLFPTEKADVAAELALHYLQLGPVLIAAARRDSAVAVARAAMQAARRTGRSLGADGAGHVPSAVAECREQVSSTVAEYAGTDHELATMARGGVGYHHAGVPEAIRRELERAYRAGSIQVLCATSTLAQGVNLPTKTVIISTTSRGRDDEMSVREFRNMAGRAGRPFREAEGHVVLVAKDRREAARLRRKYVDDPQPEAVRSTLVRLYARLVRARLGAFPPQRAVPEDLDLEELTSDGELTQWLETLDLELLMLLAEEVVETEDEALLLETVRDVLGNTLGAFQLGANQYTLTPLVRFAARRVRALAARVPDANLRGAFLRTGLSLSGCESAREAARAVLAYVESDPGLLEDERWPELRRLLLDEGVLVDEIKHACQQERVEPHRVAELAEGWMDGQPIDELRDRHGPALGVTDAMRFATVLDRLVVQNLAWVLSAVLQLGDHEREQVLSGAVRASPAMAKYGVNTEPACYAASIIGAWSRRDAMTLGQVVPAAAGHSFRSFLAGASTLDAAHLRSVESQTARLFLDRVAALLTPRDALDLAIYETGTLLVPLRGIGPMGTATLMEAVNVGEEIHLWRERDNPADVNAIAAHLPTGEKVAYLARETARVLAPLLDLEDGPEATATLAARPTDAHDEHAALQQRDVVQVRVAVTLPTTNQR